MEEYTLVKDLAIIMITAGAVTFLLRSLGLSPLFGYLVAGLLIGPYTFSNAPVENIEDVRLIADLGLILLLFGLGMEFSWGRIRQIGMTALLIAGAEIITMAYLGYWIGRLLGWDTWDCVFLGAALCVTSSAIAFSLLKEFDRLNRHSSRIIIGISVAEDFAAIAIIAVLTGIGRTGTAELDPGDAGYIVLKLVVFVTALVGFGTLAVPRILRMVRRLNSREAMVVTCLGLCFTAALISREIGISGVAGAFLMGALIGQTEESSDIAEMISPVRYMFGAIYFVAIGMLIDVAHPEDYLVPMIAVTAFFIIGKLLGNTLLTFLAGYRPRTSLEVGVGMPQMGEFSLAIAKVGKQYNVVEAPLYPSIALSSAIVSLISPHLMRLSDRLSGLIERDTPARVKRYFSRLSEWLQALRTGLSRESEAALRARRSIRLIIINGLIVMAIVGTGSFLLPVMEDHHWFEGTRADVLGLLVSLIMLALCAPCFVAIWRAVRSLDDSVVELLVTRGKAARGSRLVTIRIILRDSILTVLVVFAIIWSFPLISELIAIGSLALVVPLLLLFIGLVFITRSTTQIHRLLEQTFQRTLLGREDISDEDTESLDTYPSATVESAVRQFRRAFRRPKRPAPRDPGEPPHRNG